MFSQALRGAGGSFGIITSTTVKTYAAPPSVTILEYGWRLDISASTSALAAVQRFALTNPPNELGLEVVFGSGSPSGQVSFQLHGGWYGPESDLQAVLQPLLSTLPSPQWSNLYPGSYLDSARSLAGGSLNTSGPQTPDTFYAKSLITPKAAPMTESALQALMTYLANQGASTRLVRALEKLEGSSI